MNELTVNKGNAILKTNDGNYVMTAEMGKTIKTARAAIVAGEKSNMTLAVICAGVRANKTYENITREDGAEVCRTYGDFAEKVLDMSAAYATQYANVGEFFAAELESGYKFGQLTEFLKLRKLTDVDGNPYTASEIIAELERCGITPDSTIKAIRTAIDALLHGTTGAEDDGESDGDGDGEDTTEDDKKERRLDALLDVLEEYATDKKSKQLYDKFRAYILDMYDVSKQDEESDAE